MHVQIWIILTPSTWNHFTTTTTHGPWLGILPDAQVQSRESCFTPSFPSVTIMRAMTWARLRGIMASVCTTRVLGIHLFSSTSVLTHNRAMKRQAESTSLHIHRPWKKQICHGTNIKSSSVYGTKTGAWENFERVLHVIGGTLSQGLCRCVETLIQNQHWGYG